MTYRKCSAHTAHGPHAWERNDSPFWCSGRTNDEADAIASRQFIQQCMQAVPACTGFLDLTPDLSHAEKVWYCWNCGTHLDAFGPV